MLSIQELKPLVKIHFDKTRKNCEFYILCQCVIWGLYGFLKKFVSKPVDAYEIYIIGRISVAIMNKLRPTVLIL